jgi:signal transduction histidine kinase
MKPILTSILILFCVTTTHAQKPSKLDSLKNVLAHLPAEGKSFAGDTLRVRVLCEMGEEETNPKKSHEYLSIAKLIAEKQNDKRGQLLALDKFSELYDYQPVRVMEYYMKGLAIAENLQDYQKIIKYTERIGGNYLNLNDNKQALKYAKYNYKMNEKYGNKEDILLSLNNIGIAYFSMKEYDSALIYFNRMHQQNLITKSPKVENAFLINSAKVYIEEKKFNMALINLKNTLLFDDGYKDKIAFVSNEIAQIYLLQQKLDSAFHYAKIAESASKNLNNYALINNYKVLTRIYKQIGNQNKYIQYYEKFSSLSIKDDSIKNTKLTELINLDYVAEKQSDEINNLNFTLKEKEYRNKLLFFGIITTVIVLLITFYFNKTITDKRKEVEVKNEQIQELNLSLESKVKDRTSELLEANGELVKKNFEITEALFKGKTIERERVAAELHDNLGSTLSALKWRLEALNSDRLNQNEKKIYESIKAMMSDAYEDIRNLSHNLIPKELKEKGLIGAICKLTNDLNSLEKVNIKFNYQENITPINDSISLELYSIILELVNNALKYSQASQITLNFSSNPSLIIFTIKDNGIGLNNSPEGMGIANIRKRVGAMNAKLEINNQANRGSEFRVECPI